MKIRRTFSFAPTLALTAGLMIWGGTLNAQTSPADTQAPAQSTQQPQTDSAPAQAPSQTPSPTQDQATPTQSPSQAPDQAAPTPSSPSHTSPGQTTPSPTDSAKPETQASTGAATASGAQAFSGTVVKSGDKYVLQEDGGTTYDIDHQEAVQKFEGKRVKVHGTLDATGKKIMVQ